jgi:predicted nucleic acid-binding protein
MRHSIERTLKMITSIMGSFAAVEIRSKAVPVSPSDPDDDEVFILCAIDGEADYLVSEDHSLVDLKSSVL